MGVIMGVSRAKGVKTPKGPKRGPRTGEHLDPPKGVILGGVPKRGQNPSGAGGGPDSVLNDHSMMYPKYLHFRGWLSTGGGVLGGRISCRGAGSGGFGGLWGNPMDPMGCEWGNRRKRGWNRDDSGPCGALWWSMGVVPNSGDDEMGKLLAARTVLQKR